MSRQSQPHHKIQIDQIIMKVAIAIELGKSFYWQLLCGILFVELNTGIRVGTVFLKLKLLTWFGSDFLPNNRKFQ